MVRLLLVVAVLLIGYDAVTFQGAHTRSVWASLVGLTDSAVQSARDLGQRAREDASSLN